jgi:hypothetical protein
LVSTDGLQRWSGLSLAAGGICIAIFVLVHPQGEFTPGVMAGSQAQVAHTFHFIGASLATLGLAGLLGRLVERRGRLALVAVVLAFFGTVWFSGLGMLSFAALPFIASHDPQLIVPSGAFWNETPNPIFIVGLVCFVLGFVLLGIALLRGIGLPRWSGALLILGVLLTAPPPVVVPTVLILTVGGVLLGAGLAWLGYGMWSESKETGART